MKILYPEIEPYNEFDLKVSELHTIHIEESGNQNGNVGDEFIYMAFAEAPFVNSNGVPCNAR